METARRSGFGFYHNCRRIKEEYSKKEKSGQAMILVRTYLPIWDPLTLYITRAFLVFYDFPSWEQYEREREREREREMYGW